MPVVAVNVCFQGQSGHGLRTVLPTEGGRTMQQELLDCGDFNSADDRLGATSTDLVETTRPSMSAPRYVSAANVVYGAQVTTGDPAD